MFTCYLNSYVRNLNLPPNKQTSWHCHKNNEYQNIENISKSQIMIIKKYFIAIYIVIQLLARCSHYM